jgi:ankyrin repeat protein
MPDPFLDSIQTRRLNARIEELPPLARCFFKAALEGDVDALRDAVESGADPAKRLLGGASALMVASSQGRVLATRFLSGLGGPQNLFAQDDAGASALHKAASHGRSECVKTLLERPRSRQLLTQPDRERRTPFLRAALRGDVACLEALFEGSDPAAVDVEGRGALHLAAQSGSAPAVALLAPLYPADTRSAQGETPFHCAASFARPEVLALLLNASGAVGVDLLDHQGQSPLESLCAGAPTPSAFSGASAQDPKLAELECCRLLIKAGSDLLRADFNGLRALDWACLMNKPLLACELIQAAARQGLDAQALAAQARRRAEQGNHLELAALTTRWALSSAESHSLAQSIQVLPGSLLDDQAEGPKRL